MPRIHVPLAAALLGCSAALMTAPLGAQTPAPTAEAKKKVTKADELPRRLYTLPKLPSELLDVPLADLRPLADAVARDLAGDLASYDIEDRSTLEGIAQAQLTIAMVKSDFAAVRPQTTRLRELADKPAGKQTAGVAFETIAATRAAGGDLTAQRARLREALTARYASMPWAVVEPNLRQAKGQFEVMNPELARGAFRNQLDALAKNNAMQVPTQAVMAILGARVQVEHLLPFRDDFVAVLGKLIDANQVAKADTWTPRLVALPANAKAQPVVVGVWDSGVDPKLFTMTQPQGLAFDGAGQPMTELLRPLGDAQSRWPQLRTYIKGAFDNQSALDTPESRSFKQHIAQLKSDQVKGFQEDMAAAGMYVHGTHVAGIAVAGNPFAKVYAVSMHWPHSTVPPKPDEATARRIAANYQTIVDGLKAAKVRVVNMSWRYGPGFYEAALAFHGVGKDAEERKRLAGSLFRIERDALEKAIASAPEILFVAGAGNEDNDASVVEYIPAGLSLPNLITAGAVDQSGDETSFSSFGKTVVVHANGKDVDSLFPGGDRARLSGTSMAAPQVTNLAAKLFALNPQLTTAEVKALILKGAEKKGRVNLINPQTTLGMAGYKG